MGINGSKIQDLLQHEKRFPLRVRGFSSSVHPIFGSSVAYWFTGILMIFFWIA
jgi:hypothetical protein